MKIRKIVSILLFVIIINSNISLASFAEYDDETAKKETEKIIEEQEKEHVQSENKSNNNYLKSLSVEKYELTPEFDKQIQEYKIDGNVGESVIDIKAQTEDERAGINGTGSVELKKGENKIRIDVTSERGTVRTYFLEVNYNDEKNEILRNENKENARIENNKTEKDEKIPMVDSKEYDINQNMIIIVIMIIVFFIIFIIFLIKKLKKKSKH